MIRLAILVAALSACTTTDGSTDVHGPYTGEVRRFVVDGFTLPRTNTDARILAGDVNGDGTVDNQLGMVISTLAGMGNVTDHDREMIAAGAIKSSVEIVADDFANDASVSVRYIGADGEPSTPTGGSLVDGVYISNPSGTTHYPGAATLYLPVFVDADATRLPLVAVQMTLTPDTHGGYDATISGTTPHPDVLDLAYGGVNQMLENDPTAHIGFLRIFDLPPFDWKLSHDELVKNTLMVSLFAPDIHIAGHTKELSLGFGVHLSPCAEGTCPSGAEATCYDRVKNGDEADVDCGGACRGCTVGATCSNATDCETAACVNDVCGPPSCTNGSQDSFESDTDCGTICGVGCAAGKRCYLDSDCASGSCGAPCTSEYWCSNDYAACN